MNIPELAKELNENHCHECGCVGVDFNDFNDCSFKNCWCHKDNDYKWYKNWLKQESEEKQN